MSWKLRELSVAYGGRLKRECFLRVFGRIDDSILEGFKKPKKAYCTLKDSAGSLFRDAPSQFKERADAKSNRKVKNLKGLWSHINPQPTAILHHIKMYCVVSLLQVQSLSRKCSLCILHSRVYPRWKNVV